MNATVFPVLKTGFAWTDPTQNVDGSAVAAGEITGYTLGVRSDSAAGSAPGAYPQTITVTGATVTTEAIAAFLAALTLAPGNYWAAVQAQSTTNGPSGWSNEAPFQIPAPVSPPQAPTGFSAS